jgi:hypothetical protein
MTAQDVKAAALEVTARAVCAAHKIGAAALREDAFRVDFVANEMQRIFPRELRREYDLCRCEHAASGIVGAAQQEGARGAAGGRRFCCGCAQCLARQNESGRWTVGGDDFNGSANAGVHVEAEVVRGRHDDGVAGVGDGEDEVVEHLRG